MQKITIYSTPSCPYCVMVKKYLEEKNIPFKEVDVSVDTKAAVSMQEKSGQMGVPVVIIEKDKNENIIVGFDKGKIDKILNI